MGSETLIKKKAWLTQRGWKNERTTLDLWGDTLHGEFYLNAFSSMINEFFSSLHLFVNFFFHTRQPAAEIFIHRRGGGQGADWLIVKEE